MKIFQALIITGCCLLSSPILSAADKLQSDPENLGFESFRIIHQRNVFDPNRRKPIPLSERRRDEHAPVRTVSFTLQGTMSYGSRAIAFFNGTKQDYRKSVDINDGIGNIRNLETNQDEA